jgi:hypothetical protein
MRFEWVKTSNSESYTLVNDCGLVAYIRRWENDDNHKGDWSITLRWKRVFITGQVGFDYVRLQAEEMIRGHLLEVIRHIESRS